MGLSFAAPNDIGSFDLIVSDVTDDRAWRGDGLWWHQTAYGGRRLDYGQAITAMTLAEALAEGHYTDPKMAAHVAAWLSEMAEQRA
jgi:L-arabinose isomerase